MDTLETIGLAALIFASANIGDFFLLLALFASGQYRRGQVIVGQYLGTGVLVLLSLGAACGAVLIPRQWFGLLGLLPLVVGVRQLIHLLASSSPAAGDESPTDLTKANGRPVLTVAALTIGQGGDDLGAYAPLFAAMRGHEMGVMLLTFAVLTLAWCAASYRLARRAASVLPWKRPLRFVTPVALVLLGIWILSDLLPQNQIAPAN